MALPKVGDTINLAETIAVRASEGVRIVISQGLCFSFPDPAYVVWVAECFEAKDRKPFLRLAGHKGETPGDLLRQLAGIYDQGEVEIKEKGPTV